jgi:hypothetical protein
MGRIKKLRGGSNLPCTPAPWRTALILVAFFLGCGGVVGSGPSQPPPSGITVTVAPLSASVLLGEPQVFTAAVNGTSDTAVIWSVNGVPSGNSTVGMIDAAGQYTAPANLPQPAVVTVEATSAADGSKSATSRVTITSDISVSVTPGSIPLELGASKPFAATVNSAGNPNRAVTWVVSGSGCVGAACGTVNSSGMYTAPQILTAPPNATLTAVSVADPSKSGTGTITITSTFSLALTGPSSVNAGSTTAFTATLTPAANSNPSLAISWSVAGTGCTGTACGTISSTGTYAAPSLPPSPATVQIIATPQADPTKAATIPVTILPVISVSISPSAATVGLGATQTFHATVTGVQDTTVTWDVNGVVGGNSTVGTIVNSQTSPNDTSYTAPQALPASGSVTVNARSNASPGIFASATVTLTSAISVVLSPSGATLAVGHRQNFTVEVNNLPNQNVAWQVNGVAGGNSTAGEICVTGSNPCQQISTSNGGSVDYLAPAGLPSPNPVTVTATSQASSNTSASASVTILPHIIVSVLPGSATMAGGSQQRFTATVAGTANQQVTWTIAGAGCGVAGACGSIDSTGLFTAPATVPSPNAIDIVATSADDTTQSATAVVTISGGPSISSLAPTSAYAGAAGGFTLLVSGSNFSPSTPGPGSAILVAASSRATSCPSSTQCTTSLTAADLQSAANLAVQIQDPDGSLSNTETFVVAAPGSGAAVIPLTPGAPSSAGNDIVVVELGTNGGSGASGNVSLNIAAIGIYSVATTSCALADSTVPMVRPASGTGTADLCLFSVSGLDPLFTYTISGPATPDITITGREPLGLGIVHLSLQVPSTAAPGPRTLFVENPNNDKAAATGGIEVR